MNQRERAYVESPRRRARRGLMATLSLLALVVAGVLIHFVWWTSKSRSFETQLQQWRDAGEPITAEELTRWAEAQAGEGADAVPALRAAAVAVDDQTPVWKSAMEGRSELAPPLTDAEVAALVATARENAEALALVDEAATKPAAHWAVPYRSPLIETMDYADLTAQRKVARLLWAAALLAHHEGNDAEALKRTDQILFLGRALDRQPLLIPHLVAVGVSAIGCSTAARVGPDLRISADGAGGAATPAQVRALIDRLLDERSLAEGQRRAWIGERVSQVDTVLSIADGRIGLNPAATPVPGATPPPAAPAMAVGSSISRYVARPFLLENGRMSATHTTTIMRGMAANADFPSYQRNVPAQPPEVTRSPNRYMLASILLPSLNRAAEQQYRAMADRRLAATCLAARWYAVEHDGRLPARLEDLVPRYLPSVPLDPLASGTPLAYVPPDQDPQRPRVYSVGPNGLDDGGVERPPESQRRLAPQNWDEVRHLKRQPRPPAQPEDEDGPASQPSLVPELPPNSQAK